MVPGCSFKISKLFLSLKDCFYYLYVSDYKEKTEQFIGLVFI